MGGGCSIVVERMPRNREIMGLIPILSNVYLYKSLKEVQPYSFFYLKKYGLAGPLGAKQA